MKRALTLIAIVAVTSTAAITAMTSTSVAANGTMSVGTTAAEVEPNNWLHQAQGPMRGWFTGRIASGNDEDWYLFNIASQAQVHVAVATTCDSTLTIALHDEDGKQVAYDATYSSADAARAGFTAPTGHSRVFLKVQASSACTGRSYRVNASAYPRLLGGSGMPVAAPIGGEPNESAAQATRLLGGRVYAAAVDTSNDEDWYAVVTTGSFRVRVLNNSDCSISVSLRQGTSIVDSDWVYDGNLVARVSHTTSRPRRHHIAVEGSSQCDRSGYHISVSPASAVLAHSSSRGKSSTCVAAREDRARAKVKIRKTKRKLARAGGGQAERRLTKQLRHHRKAWRAAQARVRGRC